MELRVSAVKNLRHRRRRQEKPGHQSLAGALVLFQEQWEFFNRVHVSQGDRGPLLGHRVPILITGLYSRIAPVLKVFCASYPCQIGVIH